MKINKKVNYSRIAVSYLFLGMLTTFIGLGAGLCLANTADVNNSNELERAIGDSNIATINIKADSITLDQKFPVVNRSLTISGEADRKSTLNGNNTQRILIFGKNAYNITINNINFNGNDEKDNLFNIVKDAGAIHAKEGTNITFNNTNFSSNTAVSHGGAIYSLGDAQGKNILLFNGITTFSSNSASDDGGAIYAKYSDLVFSGETNFVKNESKDSGGAIYFLRLHHSKHENSSFLTFNEKTTFIGNRSASGSGGAIYSLGGVQDKNTLLFNEKTTFIGNRSASGSGGAICSGQYSDLIFNEETEFTGNKSGGGAGAIYSWGNAENENILVFNGKTTFTSNVSINGSGGAIYIMDSDLTFGGEVKFENNESENRGGAIYSQGDTRDKNTLVFNGKAIFTGNNNADGVGGAIYAEDSDLVFGGEVEFEKNISEENGGAIYSWGSVRSRNTLRFNGRATFADNESTTGEGGAIYAKLSDLTFGGEVKFGNNKGKKFGGAIYARYSDLTFDGKAKFENNESENRGGAIYSEKGAWNRNILIFSGETTFTGNKSTECDGGAIYAKYSDITFGGEVKFTSNKSNKLGGAIYSEGDTHTKNILRFNDRTTFTGNESAVGDGGAIYAKLSDLTFGGEVNFTKNSSKNNGGVIYSEGEAETRNTLVFNGKTIFTRNESTKNSGGAIYAKLSDLTFGGETEFTYNMSKDSGGAILSVGDANS
ncbi:MAG: hypothetical protein LBP39_03075, partial [Rickettsiales bacterium]|nr:hypothetical protein [Rickettsiales bacterium]